MIRGRRLERLDFERNRVDAHELWDFEEVILSEVSKMNMHRKVSMYLSVAGLWNGMPWKVDVYDIVVLCDGLRLCFLCLALDAVRSAQLVAGVEVFVVKLAPSVFIQLAHVHLMIK